MEIERKAKEPEGRTPAKQEWERPSWRRLNARDAEANFVAVPDGHGGAS